MIIAPTKNRTYRITISPSRSFTKNFISLLAKISHQYIFSRRTKIILTKFRYLKIHSTKNQPTKNRTYQKTISLSRPFTKSSLSLLVKYFKSICFYTPNKIIFIKISC